MTDQPLSEQSDSPTTVLDIDGEHFRRHVKAITSEIRGLLNLYLGPRTRGRIVDLQDDLDEVIAARDRENRRS